MVIVAITRIITIATVTVLNLVVIVVSAPPMSITTVCIVVTILIFKN